MAMLGFKNLNVLENMLIVPWHPVLLSLLKWILVRYNNEKITITDAYRKNSPGVHGQIPLRGFDLRSYVFKEPQIICDDINKNWIYDPNRPEKKVAILHDIGKGMHFHLQVHPNTMYRGN